MTKDIPTATSWLGLKIIKMQDQPRYVLPEEVIPGVPWPAGFREEINQWSRGFLGYAPPLIKDGEVLTTPGFLYMNPRTYASFKRGIPA